MPIDAIEKLLPAPCQPSAPGTPEKWAAAEEQLGTSLPDDYKSFIDKYGTGGVADFIWILNPFTNNEHLNMRTNGEDLLRALRTLKEKWGLEEVPYPISPEPDGLFPWGITDNADVLYWLTRGAPSDWIVAVNEARGPLWETHDYPMVRFLVELLSGRVRSEILPVEEIAESPTFRVSRIS
ncbi:MAG: hypothetical protein GY778_11710 [bacterium]|nr:hypothetical protein [bacterium]